MTAAARRSPTDVRNDIVTAAWDLFGQLGVRTTVADVAERLGMSSANIYRCRFVQGRGAASETRIASSPCPVFVSATISSGIAEPGLSSASGRPGAAPSDRVMQQGVFTEAHLSTWDALSL